MGAVQRNRFAGKPSLTDGGGAVGGCEKEACDAVAEVAARPATLMGAEFSRAAAEDHRNITGRPLLLVEVEQESAVVSAVAGLAMTGLRATGFLSGAGLLAVRDALPALATRQLGMVLHLSCGIPAGGVAAVGMAGHEPYHAAADTGFFQLFAKDAQEAADLSLIAHRIAEQALSPGILAQDTRASTERLETLRAPERELIAEFLGNPEQEIPSVTPSQRLLFGPHRRRIPEWWSVDAPAVTGVPWGGEAALPAAAAWRPYFAEPLPAIADAAMKTFGELTGRDYARVGSYRTEDADYLIVAQGTVVASAEVVADYFRATRKVKVGVVNLTMLRPFPGDLLGGLLKNRKGVVVLERLEHPLAADPPLLGEIRGVLGKCLENGEAGRATVPYPGYASYTKPGHAPPLFSAAYGLGGAEPEAEALVGAVENLLPQGAGSRRVTLSATFTRERSRTPKEEIFLQTLGDAHPTLSNLTVRGSENPILLPKGALAVRMEELAGQELWSREENLAVVLAGLEGLHVKAFREPSEQRGREQSSFYLLAAREPVKANGPVRSVDMVIATHPRVLAHPRPLAELKDGGMLLLVSPLPEAEQVWASLPASCRAEIQARAIGVWALDAAGIAQSLAEPPTAQNTTVQNSGGPPPLAGWVLQGAALSTPPVAGVTGLTGKALGRALREWARGQQVASDSPLVAPALEALLAGMEAAVEIPAEVMAGAIPSQAAAEGRSTLPTILKGLEPSPTPALDPHRFWEGFGEAYTRGSQSRDATPLLAEPFIASGVLPPASGVFRDLASGLENFPRWLPEKCTGCGECWLVCPDSALPGLVTEVGGLLETLVERVEASGAPVVHLPRAVRNLESRLRERLAAGPAGTPVAERFQEALDATLAGTSLAGAEKAALQEELERLRKAWGEFPLALTELYFTTMEASTRGSGGLLSVTLDPSQCTGCMACVTVCEEQALAPEPLTREALAPLRRHWELWLHLPTTPASFTQPPDGAREPARMLLDKEVYHSLTGGAEGAPGEAARTLLHLYTAAVVSAIQPRVAAHVERLEELTAGLEKHIQLRLAVDVADPEALQDALRGLEAEDFTLAQLSEKLNRERSPVDAEWLRRTAGLLADLKRLHRAYTGGGRAALGMVHATGGAGGAGVRFPYHPFPFPWSTLPHAGGAGLALGLFEGHMVRMARGFRAVREAELELEERYNPALHDGFFERFDWRAFTGEELALCPPVTLVGPWEALFGQGGGAVSALLRTGRPIKVLCMDSAAHTALLAPETGEGRQPPGDLEKPENRWSAGGGSAGLGAALAVDGIYLAQGSLADIPHLMESFQAGLETPRPALFNLFNGRLSPAGAGQAVEQARLALASRAHTLFRLDTALGEGPHDWLTLAGNPVLDGEWPTRSLAFVEEGGAEATMEAPVTFADFAATLPGLGHHFQELPPEDRESATPLAEYLELDTEARAETRPFIWALGAERRLRQLAVSPRMAQATLERLRGWRTLRSLARRDFVPVDEAALAAHTRTQMVETVTQALMELAANGATLPEALAELAQPEAKPQKPKNGGAHA